jgi:hypothetical protein
MLETTHSANKFPKPATIGDDDEEINNEMQ